MQDEMLESRKRSAENWFRALRDTICAAFEREEDASPGHYPILDTPSRFVRKQWHRKDHTGAAGGGGEMSVMHGRLFEKVGVNISTVYGQFDPKFASQIPGAEESGGRFWASGISLVAHMRSPFVPAVHMNTRMIVTGKSWFGGGMDLTPTLPDFAEEDRTAFHAVLQSCCDRHGKDYYEKFSAWCDTYFYLPHRGEARGIGGIFYDYLDTGNWDADFAFTHDVGHSFLDAFLPRIAAHKNRTWTDDHRLQQKIKRGRYAEFNLLYDRGTQFGLKTGGNTEAILMSLPPDVAWV